MIALRQAALAACRGFDFVLSPVSPGPAFAAELASPHRGEYCVSKAGLSIAVSLFALRLAADGVPVYEVRPALGRA